MSLAYPAADRKDLPWIDYPHNIHWNPSIRKITLRRLRFHHNPDDFEESTYPYRIEEVDEWVDSEGRTIRTPVVYYYEIYGEEPPY
jgi:hypothetical protein